MGEREGERERERDRDRETGRETETERDTERHRDIETKSRDRDRSGGRGPGGIVSSVHTHRTKAKPPLPRNHKPWLSRRAVHNPWYSGWTASERERVLRKRERERETRSNSFGKGTKPFSPQQPRGEVTSIVEQNGEWSTWHGDSATAQRGRGKGLPFSNLRAGRCQPRKSQEFI